MLMSVYFTSFFAQRKRAPFICGVFLLVALLGSLPSSLEALVDLEAPTYRNQGYHAQQKEQWQLAVQYYQKAIALDPFYATPHNDLGIVYERQKEFEKAEQEYLKAIALDPRFLDPYANLALLYEHLGKIDQAIIYWKKRIDYGHPNDPWTRKAIERLGRLSKDEITVTYPPAKAQEDKPEAMTQASAAEDRERKPWETLTTPAQPIPSDVEDFSMLPSELYYTIGPGDELEVFVWDHPDISRTGGEAVGVRPDGRISLPLIDDVYVNGLTPKQVDAEVTERLSKTIRDPQVTIIVSQIKSRGVYVLGEVRRPGRYPLTQPMTATEMIAKAGQWMDSGVLTSVLVVRRGWSAQPEIYRVNLAQVVRHGDASHDMVLQDGDIVFIPRNFIKKLDNFLTYFTKHFFGSTGGFVGGKPVRIDEPIEIN